jgi:hypothetical protein
LHFKLVFFSDGITIKDRWERFTANSEANKEALKTIHGLATAWLLNPPVPVKGKIKYISVVFFSLFVTVI